MHVSQEVNVLRAEFAHKFTSFQLLRWPERSAANVLHLVVRNAQSICNRAVGSVLARIWRELRAPESK